MRGADPSKTQAGGGLQRRRLGRGRAPGEGRELRAARPLPRELEDVTLGVTPAAPTCVPHTGPQFPPRALGACGRVTPAVPSTPKILWFSCKHLFWNFKMLLDSNRFDFLNTFLILITITRAHLLYTFLTSPAFYVFVALEISVGQTRNAEGTETCAPPHTHTPSLDTILSPLTHS